MIDHRRKADNLSLFITEKSYILIMIILVSLQNRDQYLHGKLLCQIFVFLEKFRFKDVPVIVKHLAIVYIIIYVDFFIRIFPEKLQKILKGLSFFICHRNCGSIIKIFLIYFLITFTGRQLVLRRRHKIFIDDR